MRLKVSILLAGAVLGGAAARAEEPVAIEPIDGGFDIRFAASGTHLRLGPDVLQAVWNDTDKQPQDDDPKSTTAVGLDGAGLSAVLTGSAGYATLTGLAGGIDLDIADGPRPGCAADGILGFTFQDGGLVVRDCLSGGRVTVGPDWVTVEIEGLGFVAEFDPGKLDLPETWREIDIVTGGGPTGGVDVRDIDVASLSLSGRSTAGRVDGSYVDALAFSGDHKGVTVGTSDIGRLTAEGVLTGASLPGTTIRAYAGPGTFRIDEPVAIKR